MSESARFYIALALLVVSLVLRHGLLFLISLVLLLALAVAWFWGRHCLERVEYRRYFRPSRAFFGEEVELTVEVVNRKLLPMAWLQVEDEIPSALAPVKGAVAESHKQERSLLLNLLSLSWYERVRRRYRIRCDTRGYHTFGPARLRSGDIFGFHIRELDVPDQDSLLVYPRVVPIAQLGLPSQDPFGDIKIRQWIFEDPLRSVGVREYAYGDSLRRIHWKATARTQKLQAKVYEPSTTYRLVILLNLHTYGRSWWWLGYDSHLLELAVSVAASVANWAAERGYQVGLSANGNVRGSDQRIKISASRNPEQLTHILEALAKAQPFAAFPLEALLDLESRELPYGVTLVIVTSVLTEESLAGLMAVRAAGHRVALLLIGDEAPDFSHPGLTVYRIGGQARWREMEEIAARAPAGVR